MNNISTPYMEMQTNLNFYDYLKVDNLTLKAKISTFKDILQEVPDDIFVASVEEVSEFINLQEFSNLLDLDNFTYKDREKVLDYIQTFEDVILSFFYEYLENNVYIR